MRDKKSALVLTSLALCLVLLPLPVSAHHGTNQSYDRSAPIVVKGVVTEFRYKNPHPQLFIDVTDDQGNTTPWAIEIAPTPYTLALRGWSKRRSAEALKPGTVVSVTLAPSRAGTPVGLLQEIVDAEGEEILGDLGSPLRAGPE
jgi:hypothetical protein